MEEHGCTKNEMSEMYAATMGLRRGGVSIDIGEQVAPSESEILLRRVNDTAVAYPEGSTIHEIFERQCEKVPAAVALVFAGQELTYAQLNHWANQVAHMLLARGVKADERIGVFAERSAEMVVAMLATLKAGGAYVPLDPSYPSERLEFMAKDSSLVAILSTRELMNQLPIRDVPVVLLDRVMEAGPSYAPLDLSSRNLAYVIYTSGSIGRPKGVMIEHRSVVRLVMNTDYASIQPDDCVAHCASPSFDAATWEVWAALLNGARVVIVPAYIVLSPVLFNELLMRYSVTSLFLTVGLFNQYADALEGAFSRLRHLLVGGDVISPSIAARVLGKPVPPKRLLNAYGPTEATTFATTYEVTREAANADSLPIGRPITNTQAYVLDDKRVPVPAGVIGEIYIGGAGVARGYLNCPELTEERFIDDPFSDVANEKLYKTGDRGRWRGDGALEFLGRSDYQVKVRGFRVELAEIETALLSCPGVMQAVVIAREDDHGEKRIVAYVGAESLCDQSLRLEKNLQGASADAVGNQIAHIRDFLEKKLPRYMLPTAIVALDSFPLTPNGKVDRSKLPTPNRQQSVNHKDVAAITPMEAALAEFWKEVLKLDSISIDDSFFELGGDSMMGLDIIARVAERFGIRELSVVAIFEYPTIREMAQYIDALAGEMCTPGDGVGLGN